MAMNARRGALFFLVYWCCGFLPATADMPWIVISETGEGFVEQGTNTVFAPWGFNYDHDADGKLLEDYWIDDWSKVELAFSDMKRLGANVVRIHLQVGKFFDKRDMVSQASLKQLEKLVGLAEDNGLYLDITGLGCYHKQDVPAWYDELTTQQRWAVQASFWEAIARTCADSPAIFCYDLMNEPVVPGGDKRQDNWLGPAFAGKHFVQFIARDRGGEDRESLAAKWTETMVAAIRKHDRRHLITIGLVPWSLDRPGLTSGFTPAAVAPHLDFIAVHLYPESGKLEEAAATRNGFKIPGKPLVVEETFPLKCSAEELASFIDSSQPIVSGWIGFYWGETIEQLKRKNTISAAITIGWLEMFQQKAPSQTNRGQQVVCEGRYPHHLQGVGVGDRGDIFWSFTTRLVRTDSTGKVLKAVDVVNHHGDLCWRDGKLFVAVNLGKFNEPAGQADSWVYEYDAESLKELGKYPVPEVVHGAGGIGFRDSQFFVVGGLPGDVQENYVYQYDENWKFVQRHIVASGHTYLGIQTATFAQNRWWFGCYGDPKIMLVTDEDFQLLGRYEFDCSLGIAAANGGLFWTASGVCRKGDGCDGKLRLAVPDGQRGLKLLPVAK